MSIASLNAETPDELILEGIVVKRRGKDWLVVAVRFLQQGASVLLEDFQVEPL